MSALPAGGAFEVALYDSDFFTNASNDDLKIRPILDRQRILIGTTSNADAALMITSNTVFMNNNLYLYSKLGVGKSNLFDDYPVDIIGNTAIDGSVNATKYVLCRGLQLRKKQGSYYETAGLPTGLTQGFSNDDRGLVIYTGGSTESNYIKFLASNIDVLHIEGNGNVGIGTSNPAVKLDVVGTIATTQGINIGASSSITDYTSYIGINNSNLVIDKVNGNIGIRTSNPSTSFDINTVDAIRIPSGTTAQRPVAPSSGYMRYNTTTSTFEGFGAGSAWGSLGGVKDTNQDTYISAESSPTSNDDILRFYNSNNETLRIMPTGRIGISNQAPSERLELSGGNAKFNSNVYAMQRLAISGSNPTESLDVIGNTKISQNLYAMNWVGIGTSNPSVNLEVNGSVKVNSNLEVLGNMTVRGTTTTVDSQTVTIKDNIVQVNTGATYLASLQAGIEVNRGTGYSNYYFVFDETSQYFKVGQTGLLQTVATRDDSPTTASIPFYDGTKYKYTFSNNFIYSGGLLGVGVTSPAYRLDVAGDINFTGTLRQNGTAYLGSQWTNSSSNLYVTGSNVGIGTTSPSVPLQVATSAVGTGAQVAAFGSTSSQRIQLFDESNNQAPKIHFNAGNGGLITSGGKFSITSGGNISLLPTGNVGIGSSNPGGLLDLMSPTIGTKHLLLSGKSFYNQANDSDANGICIMNGVNRLNNRQLWFMDSTAAVNTTNCVFRINTCADGTNPSLSSISTDGTTAKKTQISDFWSSTNFGVGTSAPSAPLHVTSSSSTDPDMNGIYCYNPNNTANQDAIICARVAGSSGGNPYISWDISGEYGWSMGVDNTDANKMKISSLWNSVSSATKMTIDTSGNVGIGTTSPGYKLHVIGDIYASGDVSAMSDRRYKDNIKVLEGCLDKVMMIKGVSYTRTDYKESEKHIGLIAQEVAEVLPEAVTYDEVNGKYSLNYGCLVAPLIEAIKEMREEYKASIDYLRVQNEQLMSKNSSLETRIKRLEELILK